MSNSEEATLAESQVDRYRLAEEGFNTGDPADPRINDKNRATEHELDSPYLRQLSEYVHHRKHELEDTTTKQSVREKSPNLSGKEADSEEPIYVCLRPWSV